MTCARCDVACRAFRPIGKSDPNPCGCPCHERDRLREQLLAMTPMQSVDPGHWRVGRSLGRTLYKNEQCVGIVDTPELAAEIVAACNGGVIEFDPSAPRRLRTCVENWPQCEEGKYDPRCCRFPKSCSCTVYDPKVVKDSDLEPGS